MANQPTESWWLAVGGQPQGPFSTEQLTRDLQSGRVSGESLVCPMQGSHWAAVATFPQLAPSIPSCPPLPGGAASEWLMLLAGWYELVGVPCLKIVIWVLSGVLSSIDPQSPSSREQSIVEFVAEATLVVLMIGGCVAGVKLLRGRRDGVVWMTAIVAGQWIVGIVAMGLLVLLAANAPAGSVEAASESSTAGLATFLLIVGALLCACSFEVIAIVWLWCIRPFLPRPPNM